MRKGEKFRSLGVPMLRRTWAPAPSDCSRALKAKRMERGTDMLDEVSSRGSGRPRKLLSLDVVFVDRFEVVKNVSVMLRM